MSAPAAGLSRKWLEADGLGGFASGTAAGPRTRRYHALLLTATMPPNGRMVLVNGVDAWIEPNQFLTRQCYVPDALTSGAAVEEFSHEPWPRWVYRLSDDTLIEHELFVPHGARAVVLRWRLLSPAEGPVPLRVRPLLSGRDFHSLHHENAAFRFDSIIERGAVRWQPYPGVPPVVALANGQWQQEPAWYRGFVYLEERARGLDFIEDLAAPGIFEWDLSRDTATLILTADPATLPDGDGAAVATRWRAEELRRRRAFTTPLSRAGDAYLVRRGSGRTIIAGYPWFGDWGRDTFIALRGLCLATGRLAEAREILLEWADQVSGGMLPNRFVEKGDAPEFNSVDAALWYVVAVHEFLTRSTSTSRRGAGTLRRKDCARLQAACRAIMAGYAGGTRHGIHLDQDGLLAAGEPGVQLTWMDAKVGEWVVTPRIGKPVEIQALWLNALRIVSAWDPRGWREIYFRGLAAFDEKFWNPEWGWLNDVVDVDHLPGQYDASLRPNQIFAVGGLPFPVLGPERARRVVEVVETNLLTPLGLRSLAPADPRYAGRYEGGVRERDGSYHQGTVWPWLLGPFVEAWLRVRGSTLDARREARARFLEPLMQHVAEGGLGHVSEIADAEPPHTPRGCPFQAWSVGEALRLQLQILPEGDD
jgi:predicted glycogen debranching enzyme